MDNFKVIYRILRYLERAMDWEDADTNMISFEKLGITEQRWIAIIEMLVENGYVKGIAVKRCAGGAVPYIDYPQITLKGLEYLVGNPLMQSSSSTTS